MSSLNHVSRYTKPLSMAVMLAAILSGCASVPNLGEKPGQLTPQQLSSNVTLNAHDAQWIIPDWWRQYGDAQLDALVTQALITAPDVASAQARILKAEGYAQQAGATLQPNVDLNGSLSRQKQSYNNGLPRAAQAQGFNTYGRVALDFGYELDFWGKNRAAVAAAISEVTAAKAEAAQTKLMLSTAIAANYAELAHLHAKRDAVAQEVQVRRHSEVLLSERQRNGLENLASVHQAASRRAAAEANLQAVEEAIALQGIALAALVGEGPDRALTLQRPQMILTQIHGVPSSLPAELLARRPDLVSARLRTEAASAGIKVAEAGFYPNVNLTAYVGVQSMGLDMLSKGGAGIAGIGPAINLPIFRGGQLEGSYRVARADYELAVASYNQTLIRALHEVAEAITRQRALGAQIQSRKEALLAAKQAYQVAQDRYQGGLGDYLAVLSAEDSVIDTRLALTDVLSQQFTQDIALIKALGGGYQAGQA